MLSRYSPSIFTTFVWNCHIPNSVGKIWAPAHVDLNNVACHLEYIMNSGNTLLQKGYPLPLSNVLLYNTDIWRGVWKI